MLNADDATDDLELVVQAPSRAASDSRQTSIDASISRSGPVAPKGFGDYFKTIGRFGLGFNQIKTARSAKAKLNRPNQAIQKLATSNKLVSRGRNLLRIQFHKIKTNAVSKSVLSLAVYTISNRSANSPPVRPH